MYVYIRKLFTQDTTKQISFTKQIAQNFLDATSEFLNDRQKMNITCFHFDAPNDIRTIELQPATDYRFSIGMSTLLKTYQGNIVEGDLLYMERMGSKYGVKLIKPSDPSYKTIAIILNENDRHLLLCSSDGLDLFSTSKSPRVFLSDSPCRSLLAAIRTKPFLLLAGLSGTGKTRIVRQLARACWPVGSSEHSAQKPKNFELIPVQPNWHDATELIGYYSTVNKEYAVKPFLEFIVKAWEEPTVPYFLCLDEMNLAPVEQYFADYLSVIETRSMGDDGQVVTDPILPVSNEQWYVDLIQKLAGDAPMHDTFLKHGISLPPNLVVIGTVNMDETTYAFSRKVLDRAMTIEMNEVNLRAGLDGAAVDELPYIEPGVLTPKYITPEKAYGAHGEVIDYVVGALEVINKVLEGSAFKIAYRSRNEIALFVVNAVKVFNMGQQEALDLAVNMKILPRIEGDAHKTQAVIESLQKELKEYLPAGGASFKKLAEMQAKLKSQHYCTYWT